MRGVVVVERIVDQEGERPEEDDAAQDDPEGKNHPRVTWIEGGDRHVETRVAG
jgi:hypothetical protein